MKREKGYYWVNINTVDWRICYWTSNCYWLQSGNLCAWNDSDFVEIDERRIEREN